MHKTKPEFDPTDDFLGNAIKNPTFTASALIAQMEQAQRERDEHLKRMEYFQDEKILGNAVLLPVNGTTPVVRMKDLVDDRKSFRKKKVEKEDGVLFNRSIRKHFNLDTFPRLKRFLSPELKRIVSQTA